MLFMGVDVSGTPGSGNYGHMGVAACTQAGADRMAKMLERHGLDLTSRKQDVRNAVLNEMNFDMRQYAGFCIRLERGATLEKLTPRLVLGRGSNPALNKIIRRYHNLHFASVRDPLEEFLNGNGYALTSMVVESDTDSRGFVADIGLRSTKPSYAHTLADAVAWANHRGIEPNGVISVDRVDEIARRLKRK